MGKPRIWIVAILLAALAAVGTWHFMASRGSGFPDQTNSSHTEQKRPPGSTAAKLKSIHLPAFKHEDISVEEFIDYLRFKSIAHDPDPGEFAGIDIRIVPPGEGFQEDESKGQILTGKFRIKEIEVGRMCIHDILNYAWGGSSRIRWEVRDEVLWIHGPADAHPVGLESIPETVR